MRAMPVVAVAALAAVAVSGCQDQANVTPPPSGISATISDGAHGGNAHFFFLSPLVPTPSYSGTFNPDLKPAVAVCEETGDIGSPCVSGPPVVQFSPDQVSLDTAGQQYSVNWKTSGLDVNKNYRIRVLIGSMVLGVLDVDPVLTPQEVPNTQLPDRYVFLLGRTLPIKFRIEHGALCGPTTDCGEGTVGPGGGTVVTDDGFAGADFPPNALDQDVAVIIERLPAPCLPTDLPQFNACYRFHTEPYVANFNVPVTVGICADIGDLTDEQADYLLIHSVEEPFDDTSTVTPHNNTSAGFVTCSSFATANQSPVARYALAGLHAVLHTLAPMLDPTPLYAIHNGLGGTTLKFSRYEWALPAEMYVSAGDNQTASLGTAVAVPPSVVLRDSAGEPVANAIVTWNVTGGGGSITGAVDTTGGDGIAQVGSWTLGGYPGTNTLTATTRGAVNSPITFTATAIQRGIGTPTIDGVMSPGEWDAAYTQSFTANVSGGSGVPATLYWMNDGTNIYFALRFPRASTDKVNTLQLNFDNNANGIAEAGDDILILDGSSGFADWYLTAKCTSSSQSSCGEADTKDKGTTDGSGAFGNDGSYSVYEIAHPLNSGDVGHDFALSFGSHVGVYVTLGIGHGAQGNTQYPGFRVYLPITVTTPLAP